MVKKLYQIFSEEIFNCVWYLVGKPNISVKVICYIIWSDLKSNTSRHETSCHKSFLSSCEYFENIFFVATIS